MSRRLAFEPAFSSRFPEAVTRCRRGRWSIPHHDYCSSLLTRGTGWHQRLAVSKGKWREINTLQAALSYCYQGMDRAFPALTHRSMWRAFQSSYHNQVRFMTLLYAPCLQPIKYSNFFFVNYC